MRIVIKGDTIESIELDKINSGAIQYYEAELEFDEQWNGLEKKAVIVSRNEEYSKQIGILSDKIYLNIEEVNNYCIGFVGYKIESGKKIKQISTNLRMLPIAKGAGQIKTSEYDMPTPTEWELYIKQIRDIISNIPGIPKGGTSGQVLKKKSNDDYDTEWEDEKGGTGGTSNHAELENLDFNNSGHTGFQAEIEDLDDIREGANLGLKAVQDDNYVHTDNNYTSEEKNKLANIDMSTKVDKIEGKDLSSNDFTNEHKSQVENNTKARHSHSNKTILDAINSTNIDNWNSKSNFSGNYNDLENKPTIPSQITEATISNWGFTKNTGTYSKPTGGIPKADLESSIQASLEKANSALQEHQDISGKQNILISGNNIKTINGLSILGEGDMEIGGSGVNLNSYGHSTSAGISQNFLTSKIAEIIDSYIQFAELTFVSGYLKKDGTTVEHATYKNAEFGVIAGTTFSYTNLRTPSSSSYPIICFYSKDKTLISYVLANDENFTSGTVDVPDNAYYAKVSTYYSSTYPVNITTKQYSDKVTRIDEELASLKNNVGSYDNVLYTDKYNSLFYRTIKDTLKEGYYLNSTGQEVANANCAVTDYIEVMPNSVIYYNLFEIGNITSAVCIYDKNKTFISNIKYGSSSSEWVFVNGSSTLPDNAKYVKLGLCKNANFTQIWQQMFSYTKTVALNDFLDKQWNGKKWCAFGTSITDMHRTIGQDNLPTGKYVQFLANNSGLILNNKGISGGTISNGGVQTTTGDILTNILATDVSDYDLITLEGFVNDFAASVPIGEITDTEKSTLCGAIYQAVTYFRSNSNALICLITDSTGQQFTLSTGIADYRRTKQNSNNKVQLDYNQAIIKMGQYLGVPVIDAGGKSMVNENKAMYLSDHIHQSVLGGEQYAQTIWNELKLLQPTKL